MNTTSPDNPTNDRAFNAWLQHRQHRASTALAGCRESALERLRSKADAHAPLSPGYSEPRIALRLPLPFSTLGASMLGIARVVVFLGITLLPA